MGRRQAVRHWILIPAFGGSIPPAPATQSADWEQFPRPKQKPLYSGFIASLFFRRANEAAYWATGFGLPDRQSLQRNGQFLRLFGDQFRDRFELGRARFAACAFLSAVR